MKNPGQIPITTEMTAVTAKGITSAGCASR